MFLHGLHEVIKKKNIYGYSERCKSCMMSLVLLLTHSLTHSLHGAEYYLKS